MGLAVPRAPADGDSKPENNTGARRWHPAQGGGRRSPDSPARTRREVCLRRGLEPCCRSGVALL